jgi:hypothetical protein
MSAAMDPSQQQAQRPRANTHFSFRSDKSNELHTTKSNKTKHERKVSDSERRQTHYDPGSKANPNAAMNEAQPSTSARLFGELRHCTFLVEYLADIVQSPLRWRSRLCSLYARSNTQMPRAIQSVRRCSAATWPHRLTMRS